MSKHRLVALDQVRGLAITAMIAAHFGPGIYEQIGLTGITLDILNLFGRFATPAFIAVFGLTLGAVYINKAKTDPVTVRNKLFKRAFIVFGCALLIAIPRVIETAIQHAQQPFENLPFHIVVSLYSVLIFYTVAIFLIACLIRFLSNNALSRCVILGSVFIFAGTILGFEAWGPAPETGYELLRLVFVSGKYAVLTCMGCALLFAPVGNWIFAQHKNGRIQGRMIIAIFLCLMLLALSNGRIIGWRTLSDLATGYIAPPHLWYLIFVMSAVPIALVLLHRLTLPFASKALEITGRNPLKIYSAHMFVLPAVAALKHLTPGLPGAIPIFAPLTLFFLYWAFIIYKSERG